jgi:hypothetical protein
MEAAGQSADDRRDCPDRQTEAYPTGAEGEVLTVTPRDYAEALYGG